MFSRYIKNTCKRVYRVAVFVIGGGVFSVCDISVSCAAILDVTHLNVVDIHHVGF